jgi:hypothetical protein
VAVRRSYWTATRNVCAERDFNRIDSKELPPEALEKALGKFEDKAAEALKEVATRRRSLGSEAWLYTLNLMALLATRNPTSRLQQARRASRELCRVLDDTLATREQWEAAVASAKAAGHIDQAAEVDCERHRDFITRRRFKLSFEPSFHVIGEFKALDVVLRLLLRRRWLLLEASNDSRGFVTTDRPVCVSRLDGSNPSSPTRFDDPETSVMFAISPTLLAYGTFAGREGITKIDRRLVAKANLTLLQYADRRLFASHEGFEVNSLKPDTPYVVGADVLKIVAERVEFTGE